MVKGLGIFCKYSDRGCENRRVIQRANFKYHRARRAWSLGSYCCPAIGAEESCYGVIQVRATKAGGFALDVAKCRLWDHNEDVGISASNILTLATMTLHLRRDVAFKGISDLATITSTVYVH